MADQSIHWEASSDHRQMSKDLAAAQREVEKLTAGFKKQTEQIAAMEKQMKQSFAVAKKEIGDTTAAGNNMAAGMTKYFAGLITAGGAVATVVATIRAEYQNLIEMQDKALASQQKVGRSRSQLMFAMSGMSEADKARTLSESKRISSSSGVPLADIELGMAAALGGTMQKVDQSFAMMATVAKAMPLYPEAMEEMINNLSGTMKLLKTSDPRHGMGFVLGAMATSNVSDPSLMARNFSRGTISGVPLGGTAAESAALWSGLTFASQDVRGEEAGTANVQVFAQIREFFQRKSAGLSAGIYGGAGNALSSLLYSMPFSEKIKILQTKDRLGEQFIHGSSFEAKPRGQIEDFIRRPDSELGAAFLSNKARLEQGAPAHIEELNSTMTSMASDIVISTAHLAAIAKNTAENRRIDDTASANKAIFRTGLQELQQATGSTALKQKLTSVIATIEGMSSDEAMQKFVVGELRGSAADLIDGPVTPIQPLSMGRFGVSLSRPPKAKYSPSKEDVADAKYMESLAASFELAKTRSADDLVSSLRSLDKTIKDLTENPPMIRDAALEKAEYRAEGKIPPQFVPTDRQRFKAADTSDEVRRMEQQRAHEQYLLDSGAYEGTDSPDIIFPRNQAVNYSLSDVGMASSIAQGRPRIRKIGAMNANMARSIAKRKGRGAALMAEAEAARAHRMSDTSDYQSSLRGERADRNEEHRARIEAKHNPGRGAANDAAALAELTEQTRQTNVYLARINSNLENGKRATVASAALVGMNSAGMAG